MPLRHVPTSQEFDYLAYILLMVKEEVHYTDCTYRTFQALSCSIIADITEHTIPEAKLFFIND